MVIEATDSPSNVANAVAVSPLGPVGASTVTVGVDVYPVPPDPTEIVCTDSNSSPRNAICPSYGRVVAVPMLIVILS